MYLLNTDRLLPGDIVLTTQDAKVSKAIRRLTGGAFSHAMLYVGASSVIHSDQLGVHSQNTQRLLLDTPSAVMVLRLTHHPDKATIRKVCDYARAAVGTQYSIPEAIASRTKRRSTSSSRANRQFCSRLVAEAYAYAGYLLVSNPSYCYPSDLHNINLVVEIPNCVRVAKDIEITFAKSPSPIEVQTRVTNIHLAKLRSIASEDIQGEQQTVDCLQRRPDLDEQFTESLNSSGYLQLWQIDVDANPWRYKDSEFSAAKLSSEARLCEIRSAQVSIERFSHMLQTYENLSLRLPLKYFATNVALYKKLLDLNLKRVSLMQQPCA